MAYLNEHSEFSRGIDVIESLDLKCTVSPQTVKQMWPYICQFVEKLFHETIEPAVKESNAHLSTFCFSKIHLGDKPLRVNGVKVYTENVDQRQIIMDLQISFVGNTEIDVDIKRYYCKAGIKSIQIHGVLRVVMEPLLGDMPLIGALSVFFLKKPNCLARCIQYASTQWKYSSALNSCTSSQPYFGRSLRPGLKLKLVDINWTGLSNILDIPGLKGFSDNLIQDIIYSYLVLPNRITIPLVGDVELAKLRFPMPKHQSIQYTWGPEDPLPGGSGSGGEGHVFGGLIKGKSDPYGVLQIGNQLFQSKAVKESLNPKWNEVYEALVYEHSGQHLEIELFDEDPDKDDFLGSLMIDMTELHKEQKVDEWFDLEEAPTGKLHLKLEWLSLLATPEKLDKVLRSVRADRSLANDGLSSALLVVYLDSAKNLPSNLSDFTYDGLKQVSVFKALKSAKKSSSEPSPFVQFTVGHKTLESKIRYKTKEPLWEDCFSFFVHNPKRQELELEVKDDKHKCTLGNLTVPLSSLLTEENMTLTQSFPLKNSGPSSTIKLRMALRILSLEKQVSSDLPSSVQHRDGEPYSSSPLRSNNNNQKPLSHKDSTASLASDISLPFATLELQQRLRQLQNGSAPGQFLLGEVQLTVRHSSQRNRLIVVLHACRNLIAFTKDGSDPFIRLYLLPDKSRTGRRKTSTMKRTLNPVYDQTFEFSVSMVELHRRTLDVAVKNGGSILSKHKGFLGKVLVDLSGEDISKGWTQWYDLSDDGVSSQSLRSIHDPLLS
ncbi:hypothetical protein KUCAC02_033918 [Chaenocephalus aceratus]|nr:hypothetical protein KUCAC02_033918 [Chaenocephalus aceratus]